VILAIPKTNANANLRAQKEKGMIQLHVPALATPEFIAH
jgi:hypothetical protein